jgi:hypothetical protein
MSYCVFLFTSSYLLEGICLIVFSSLPPVVCWRCLIVFSSLPPVTCWGVYVLLCFPLYLQLFVGGYMSYCVFLFTSSCLLEGICLIVFSSLPPVTCWRVYVLLCFPLYLQQATGGKEENTIRHIPSNKQLEVKRKPQ